MDNVNMIPVGSNIDDVPLSQATESQQASSSRLSTTSNVHRKKRSEVWENFEEIVVDGVTKAQCQFCKQIFANTLNGTNHLRRHKNKCHNPHITHGDPHQSQLNVSAAYGLSNFVYDHARDREGLAIYTAGAEQPFTFGADPRFERYQRTCVNPQWRSVSRNTIRSDALKVFKKQKQELIEFMAQNNFTISCTSDMWSGINHLGYFCLTAHYIDPNWVIQKRIIAFRMLEYPHGSHTIFNSVMEVFREYNVVDRIFSMTFDNATANTAAIDLFRRNLKVFYGGSLFHVRCVCHVINLIVQDGLEIFNDCIRKIRNAIHYLRSSNSRLQEFNKFCKNYEVGKGRKFQTDTLNRWNTTYLMLNSCIKHSLPITDFINQKLTNQNDMLSQFDWEVADMVLDFLRVFYDATNLLSGVYYPTSCLVLNQLYLIAAHLEQYRDNPYLSHAIYKMEEKFNKYYEQMPLLFCLAAVMDPRIKLDGVGILLTEFGKINNTRTGIDKDVVEKKLNELDVIYTAKYSSSTSSTSTSIGSSSSSRAPSKRGRGIFSMMASHRNQGNISSSSDLFKYLEIDFVRSFTVEQFENLDILHWWKENETLFPILSIMARDLLTPPMSTVASESAFSAGGRVLSEKRSRLNSESLDCLICLKDWDDAKFRVQDKEPDEDSIVTAFTNMDMDDLIVEEQIQDS